MSSLYGWTQLANRFPSLKFPYYLQFHFSLSCIGEGNGNRLQCSCLENPRDGEAWWAAIYGVTQSWTRLKQLSSSSSSSIHLWEKGMALTSHPFAQLRNLSIILGFSLLSQSNSKSSQSYILLLLLLLLSHFRCVQLCATPETAAHQAPPPLGFSRQEHWSRLPFPSPMHESEK